MKQHQNQLSTKKRLLVSPSKTQTSIVAYSSSSMQKKSNNNSTPPRTAVDRALNSILPSTQRTPPRTTFPKEVSRILTTMNELSNNPYAPLVEDKEDTDETQQEEFHSKLTLDMEGVESNSHPLGPVSDTPHLHEARQRRQKRLCFRVRLNRL